MADIRSNIRNNPYFGTYNPKPVLVQAPDALIFINEEHTIPVCLECNAKVSVKSFITSIGVSLSLEGSGGGSANFDLQVPRHAGVSFIRDGKSVLANMMEVEIWFKGAFTINGMPRYYRSFWGYINNISDDYSDGQHAISVSCVDMLSWWNVMKFNVNAALLSTRVANQRDLHIWQTRFKKANPFQILATLTMVTRLDLVEIRSFFNESVQSEDSQEVWRQSADQLMKYWQRRMNKISKAIRIYGVQGQSIFDGVSFVEGDKKTKKDIARALSFSPGDLSRTIFGVELSTNEALFSPFVSLGGNIDLFQSEMRGRLDIMVQVKDTIGWEFYLDTNGEIVFKPPYYNIDVKQNFPVSWIRDIDVLNWNFSEAEPEATRVDVIGQFGNAGHDVNFEAEISPNGTYQDFNLARQYGIRTKNIEAKWLKNGIACGFKAIDEMAKIASNRFQASVTIAGRPEIRMGLPVYIESRDSYWYVNNITHSFAFGSSFTTTLGLSARRARFSSTDLLPFSGQEHKGKVLNIDANGIGRDGANRNIGIPNVIMKQATKKEFDQLVAEDDPSAIGAPDSNNENDPKTVERQGGYKDNAASKVSLQIEWDNHRRGISWNVSGGLWVYGLDPNEEILQVRYCPPDSEEPDFHLDVENAALPVSDANGYEVIGGFPYGRGLIIDDQGSIGSPGGTDNEGNPILTTNDLQKQVDQAITLRNATPDDEVEVLDGIQTAATMGGGILSGANVMKVDQTNEATFFTDMAPDDIHAEACTCLDNYTLDNLLLQNLGSVFTDVFDKITGVDELLSDSYQVDITDVNKQEADKKLVKGSGRQGVGSPTSPTVSEVERLFDDRRRESSGKRVGFDDFGITSSGGFTQDR